MYELMIQPLQDPLLQKPLTIWPGMYADPRQFTETASAFAGPENTANESTANEENTKTARTANFAENFFISGLLMNLRS
jgi:hypothetical protein